MRISTTIAAILLSTSVALADARSESNQTLTTVARWGMCLVDTMGEEQAKGIVYATVAKVDASFQRKYGRKATDFAQEAHGDNFVQHYYDQAKASHARLQGDRAGVCKSLSQRVVSLAQ